MSCSLCAPPSAVATPAPSTHTTADTLRPAGWLTKNVLLRTYTYCPTNILDLHPLPAWDSASANTPCVFCTPPAPLIPNIRAIACFSKSSSCSASQRTKPESSCRARPYLAQHAPTSGTVPITTSTSLCTFHCYHTYSNFWKPHHFYVLF